MRNEKYYILVADDDKEIRDILKLLLLGENCEVITAGNGNEILNLASDSVDLYILDINMPGMSGFMAAAELRRKYDAPIIFLTAYSGESDKVMGFSVGADDYIVKPFSNMELLIRGKAILRRTVRKEIKAEPKCAKNQLMFKDLVLDLDNQSLIKGEEIIKLTYTEFKILELFITNKKKIFGRL